MRTLIISLAAPAVMTAGVAAGLRASGQASTDGNRLEATFTATPVSVTPNFGMVEVRIRPRYPGGWPRRPGGKAHGSCARRAHCIKRRAVASAWLSGGIPLLLAGVLPLARLGRRPTAPARQEARSRPGAAACEGD